ncbi:MAG: transposase [Deltaproteobacteria bacterium]|nr:transposase [Deltaproteobacteria bacterium]
MPRTARVVNPGWPHHVVVRGNNRRRICSYPSDYRRLTELVEDASRRERCFVHALCLMSNHAHIIVTPPTNLGLSSFVRRFAQPFAQRRNRQRDGSGKLFEQRFFSQCIGSDEQLAICTAYVELNPVRAGLTADPGEYLWSTYRLHARDSRPSMIRSRLLTPSPWYLALGADDEARSRAYREFVAAVDAAERRPDDAPPDLAKSTRRLERPDRTRAA